MGLQDEADIECGAAVGAYDDPVGATGKHGAAEALAFETAASQYDWLNRIIAIGTGQRPPEGPIYDVFEVL